MASCVKPLNPRMFDIGVVGPVHTNLTISFDSTLNASAGCATPLVNTQSVDVTNLSSSHTHKSESSFRKALRGGPDNHAASNSGPHIVFFFTMKSELDTSSPAIAPAKALLTATEDSGISCPILYFNDNSVESEKVVSGKYMFDVSVIIGI